MSLAKTERVFLSVLRAALRNEKAALTEQMEEQEWERLIMLAIHHKLLPMVVCAVPMDRVPNGLMLKRGAIRQAARQTMHTAAFLELYAAMESAGFHPRVVKGIVCRGLYPQGDLRPSSDEDVYVPDREFAACCDFLRRWGMEPTNGEAPADYEIGWINPGTGLYIELHRRLFAPDSQAYGDLEDLFTDAGTADYTTETGAVIRSLPPHDHMLYLILHAYKHFVHSGFGIRQVCDIGLWAARYRDQIDWGRLERQCRGCNAMKFAAAVMTIAVRELGIPLELPAVWQMPEALCVPLLTDVLCGGIYGDADSDRKHSATVTINAVEAHRTGGRHSVWKSVFLKRVYMEKKFPYLKKYPFLLPIAWCQRVFLYLRQNRGRRERISATITIGRERVELLKMYGIIQ